MNGGKEEVSNFVILEHGLCEGVSERQIISKRILWTLDIWNVPSSSLCWLTGSPDWGFCDFSQSTNSSI